jgi:hypothetical protein
VQDVEGLCVACVVGAVPEADYLSLLGEIASERVRLAEAKPIALPDEALAPDMDAAESPGPWTPGSAGCGTPARG